MNYRLNHACGAKYTLSAIPVFVKGKSSRRLLFTRPLSIYDSTGEQKAIKHNIPKTGIKHVKPPENSLFYL